MLGIEEGQAALLDRLEDRALEPRPLAHEFDDFRGVAIDVALSPVKVPPRDLGLRPAEVDRLALIVSELLELSQAGEERPPAATASTAQQAMAIAVTAAAPRVPKRPKPHPQKITHSSTDSPR